MKMIKPLITLSLALCCISCSEISQGTNKQSEGDVISRKVSGLLSSSQEHNYTLNNHTVELEILDNKNHENEQAIKKCEAYLETIKVHLENSQKTFKALENKISEIELFQDQINNENKQYKENILTLNKKLNDLSNKLLAEEEYKKTITKNLENLSKILQEDNLNNNIIYKVKSGDSLEKIARRHKTSIEELKKKNNLSSDLIIVGQELKIPQ